LDYLLTITLFYHVDVFVLFFAGLFFIPVDLQIYPSYLPNHTAGKEGFREMQERMQQHGAAQPSLLRK
jgi:hypothetical protein